MDKNRILEIVREEMKKSKLNNYAALGYPEEQIWTDVIAGFAAGDDPLFAFFKKDIGDFFWSPAEAFRHAYPDSKLTDAESTIEYLKYNQDSSSSVDSSSDSGNKTDITWVWIVIPCVCIICAAVVLYFTVFSKRKGNKSETEEDFDEMMQEIDDDDESSDDDNNN